MSQVIEVVEADALGVGGGVQVELGVVDRAFAVADTFARWMRRVAAYAVRLGHDEANAARWAARLLVGLEGAWLVARTMRSRAPFEAIVAEGAGPD